ncbi:unnamed protein product [Paramecium pentaurelia]|uniref:Uncharacterized protein n=1 Tax=Paramecium pentaurelia TaxID=43138 RepID=A0A8S1VE44_9CILI|nr:unnamed protein product [Paramecium pentaurelia]
MYTEEIKIALFGNTFVGKTHLFTKLDWERLPKVIHSNIGVEFGKKNVNSKITKQSIQSFGILTVGQERYKQISLNNQSYQKRIRDLFSLWLLHERRPLIIQNFRQMMQDNEHSQFLLQSLLVINLKRWLMMINQKMSQQNKHKNLLKFIN